MYAPISAIGHCVRAWCRGSKMESIVKLAHALLSTAFLLIVGITIPGSAKTYTCDSPESYEGKVVGDGQCVAFVMEATGAPATAAWKNGSKVHGGTVAQGTAITTFDDSGRYKCDKTGNHAAIGSPY